MSEKTGDEMAWMRLKSAAAFCDVSPRTLRRWLQEGLRHSRISGVPYVSEQALDEFMKTHEVSSDRAERIAAEMVGGL